MKHYFMISSVFIVTILLIAFLGCEGKKGPTGPQGPVGDSGTAACGTCHNVSTEILAKQVQWSNSVHATGGNFERSTSSCAPCHTSEGFRETLITGELTTAEDIENPTPQNCRTCHNIHKNYDETDYALATTAPVTMRISGDVVDHGEANLCLKCHQPREMSAKPEPGGGNIEVTSKYWGPHHGPQAVVLEGLNAYEVPGSLPYENSAHTTVIKDGCITCHMAEAYGDQAGGHTLRMEYDYHGSEKANTAGCQSCHSGLDTFDNDNVQTEVDGLLEELKAQLVDKKIMDETDHAITGTYTADQAGTLFNYLVVLEDGSHGVHNAKYVKALLTNSIEALKE